MGRRLAAEASHRCTAGSGTAGSLAPRATRLMQVLAARRTAGLVLTLLTALSCGGDDEPSCDGADCGGGASGGTGSCDPPDRLQNDGRCVAPGVQDNGCPAGEVGLEDGSCRPAGIPPELCAQGFVASGEGCEPILPADPCPGGTMAVPGEDTCREVAPCAPGRWGDIPVEGNTVHVDASYLGSVSTGTTDQPFVAIQPAIDAAEPGAIVAVAAGSYAEDLLIRGKPVRLWGVCPAEVEVVGTGVQVGTVFVREGAGGTEVRSVAIRGAAMGLVVSGATDVLAEQLWVHVPASRGINVQDTLGVTAVRIADSLIERTRDIAVFVGGSDVTMEGIVVRDTAPQTSSQAGGRGIAIQQAPDSGVVSHATLRGSLIERNHELGVYVSGCEATIEGVVVRDTLAELSDQSGGRNLGIESQPDTGTASRVALTGSLIEQGHEIGVYLLGSEANLEGVAVRDVSPSEAFGDLGYGVFAGPGAAAGHRSRLTVTAALIERNHSGGAVVEGSDATIDGIVVRDTFPRPADGQHGRGVNIEDTSETGAAANVSLSGSLVERSHSVGLFVAGSEAIIDGVIVRDTLPQQSDQADGRGVSIEGDLATGVATTVILRGSLVSNSSGSGLFVGAADATIEGTVVREVAPRAANGLFGDAVVVVSADLPATASLSACWVERGTRVGVGVYGAIAALADSVIECNPIDLDVDPYWGLQGSLEDQGGNTCGCQPDTVPCQVTSAGLEPPQMLGR